VDVQAVFIFKETRGCFDVFQFRARRQVLTQFRLHAASLIVVRLDQIDPHRTGEVLDLIGFQAR
jgi:hypothetical protein